MKKLPYEIVRNLALAACLVLFLAGCSDKLKPDQGRLVIETEVVAPEEAIVSVYPYSAGSVTGMSPIVSSSLSSPDRRVEFVLLQGNYTITTNRWFHDGGSSKSLQILGGEETVVKIDVYR